MLAVRFILANIGRLVLAFHVHVFQHLVDCFLFFWLVWNRTQRHYENSVNFMNFSEVIPMVSRAIHVPLISGVPSQNHQNEIKRRYGGSNQPKVKRIRYKPPSEFQEVEVEPILKEALSDSTELWLIQMPLTQFEPADFAGKQLSLKLTKDDGWMGCLENSHGKSYDIFGLGKRGIERFAFMPNSKSMGVRKIARHICLLKSTNENGDASRIADSSVGFSGSQIQESVKREGISHDQGTSLGSTGCKSSQVASGISFEGEEPPTKGRKKFRKEGKLNGTPTASYSKSLEESGAYDSSDPQYHSPRTNEYTEDTYTGGKKKKPKSESPKK